MMAKSKLHLHPGFDLEDVNTVTEAMIKIYELSKRDRSKFPRITTNYSLGWYAIKITELLNRGDIGKLVRKLAFDTSVVYTSMNIVRKLSPAEANAFVRAGRTLSQLSEVSRIKNDELRKAVANEVILKSMSVRQIRAAIRKHRQLAADQYQYSEFASPRAIAEGEDDDLNALEELFARDPMKVLAVLKRKWDEMRTSYLTKYGSIAWSQKQLDIKRLGLQIFNQDTTTPDPSKSYDDKESDDG
jgi:hypothetical protein